MTETNHLSMPAIAFIYGTAPAYIRYHSDLIYDNFCVELVKRDLMTFAEMLIIAIQSEATMQHASEPLLAWSAPQLSRDLSILELLELPDNPPAGGPPQTNQSLNTPCDAQALKNVDNFIEAHVAKIQRQNAPSEIQTDPADRYTAMFAELYIETDETKDHNMDAWWQKLFDILFQLNRIADTLTDYPTIPTCNHVLNLGASLSETLFSPNPVPNRLANWATIRNAIELARPALEGDELFVKILSEFSNEYAKRRGANRRSRFESLMPPDTAAPPPDSMLFENQLSTLFINVYEELKATRVPRSSPSINLPELNPKTADAFLGLYIWKIPKNYIQYQAVNQDHITINMNRFPSRFWLIELLVKQKDAPIDLAAIREQRLHTTKRGITDARSEVNKMFTQFNIPLEVSDSRVTGGYQLLQKKMTE